jgi:hypothetical protein
MDSGPVCLSQENGLDTFGEADVLEMGLEWKSDNFLLIARCILPDTPETCREATWISAGYPREVTP